MKNTLNRKTSIEVITLLKNKGRKWYGDYLGYVYVRNGLKVLQIPSH